MLLVGQEASIAHQPVEQRETQRISKGCPRASVLNLVPKCPQKVLASSAVWVPLQCHGHVFIREPESGQEKALGNLKA